MTCAEKIFTAAVIGASGFGEVHVRELVQAGASIVKIVGSTAESAKRTAQKLAAVYDREIVAATSIHEIIENPVDFVSVCSPTYRHAEHARMLLSTKSYIFVEKPFIWEMDAKQDVLLSNCDRLLKAAAGRLTVNQPAARLMEAWVSSQGYPKDLRSFVMRYQTRGKYSGKEIAVDLLPHAISALLVLLNSDGDLVHVTDAVIDLGDNFWNCRFKLHGVEVGFEFLQDSNAGGSNLSFVINGQSVEREQRLVKGRFEVSLVSGNAKYQINNPMSVSISHAIDVCRRGGHYSDGNIIGSVNRLMCELLC